jgi:alpha-tubulin suppressor-like RCC1 family protein
MDTSVFRQTLMRASARLLVFFALASGVGLLSCADSPPTAPRSPVVPASVSVGDAHTCGVTVSGAAYCWGYNLYGQLGNGNEMGYRGREH